MKSKIKITPAAFIDLKKGIDYYNKKQVGLGNTFKNSTAEIFEQLLRVPAAGSFIYDTVRFRVVPKFPFIIIYELKDSDIWIYRIFNTSQKPFW